MSTTPNKPGPETRFYRFSDLKKVLPFAETKVREICHTPGFPLPVELTKGTSPLWWVAEVEEWLATRPRIGSETSPSVRRRVLLANEGPILRPAAPGRTPRRAT